MINLGGIAQVGAAAAPQIAAAQNAQAEQRRKQQALQYLLQMYAQQQQPQTPGGIQPAPVTSTGAQPLPWQAPQGGMNSPQGGTVPLSGGGGQKAPQGFPALPNSQPVSAITGGGSQDAINAYIQQQLLQGVQDPTGMQGFVQKMQAAGVPREWWGRVLEQSAPLMKSGMSNEDKMMMMMLKQQGTLPQQETAGKARDWNDPNQRPPEKPQKEAPLVSQNDVTKAYLAHADDPDNKDKENNWHKLRNAFNSSKMGSSAAEGGDTSLSPAALDEFADKMEKTGNIPTGLGYGKNPDKVAVVNRHAEKYPDSKLADSSLDWTGETSEKRAEGTRSGAIKISSAAVDGAAKMAIESSNKFNRTRFPLFNSIEQAVSKGTGGKEIIDFNAKNNTLINEYAAAQNPRGVPRIEDKKYARDLLETAYNKGQYETGVNAIVAETKNIKGATEGVMSGKETEAPVTPETPAAADAPDYSHLWSK